MHNQHSHYDEHKMLHELKHYLPAQAPLKDFIHHNTLHAFQHHKFHDALNKASEMFGYKVYLSLDTFRAYYTSGKINPEILKRTIIKLKGAENLDFWLDKALNLEVDASSKPITGMLKANWKEQHHINLDALVHPILFRILGSYLDQGISIWSFPVHKNGFLASLREIERSSFSSFFKTKRAKRLLLDEHVTLKHLLEIVVGDESLFKQYVFDQQFGHQGWSGMVSAVEDQPQTLLDTKRISLRDMIFLELLLEIDALDKKFGEKWKPLSATLKSKPIDLFGDIEETMLHQLQIIWQEAFEWTYYDEVLTGIKLQKQEIVYSHPKSFQALFCIDDRESSMRRYLEQLDNDCETFSTPGFFGVEFFYKPENGKFLTKLCPAPVTPKYLIKETGNSDKREKDLHFTKRSHSLIWGYLISQTLGFWSAFKLFFNIFRPSMSPATASSFKHMDQFSKLTIENKNIHHKKHDLQVGFTLEEMADRVEGVLKSIGMVKDFAPLVYTVGHGSSSVNNPHYAAYDCGACSGRPGSVNARVFSFMANHTKVREILNSRGLVIPETTVFMGALHDTTRDDIVFFDEDLLQDGHHKLHLQHKATFNKALDLNAKERSRRFASIKTDKTPQKIHELVRRRSVSLFEPRPELNHATNALCIVGRASLSKGLFLDRRAFLNSFDYEIDPSGKYLFNILKAAAPVCGGINLEYFFSRVDNHRLGAGTKLPHNVIGLFGVANGIDGDLRPGLPSQMIEVHDPLRLLIIVEHFNDVVLSTIQKSPETYEWFNNEWVHLVAVNPETYELSVFKDGGFEPYTTMKDNLDFVPEIAPVLESSEDNLPVFLIG